MTMPSSRYWSIIKKVINEADIVLEVLDARDPYLTRNGRIEKLVLDKGKRLILVINKADLVPKEVLEKWKRVFSRELPTIFLSARDRLGTRYLWRYIKMYAPKFPVKVAVVGYPNVGKSMIINVLKGRHSSGTSPIPGFTKSSLRVRASTNIVVIDTPGVFPPSADERELVLYSALRPEALEDPVVPAIHLIKFALSRDPLVFEKVYGITEKDPIKILSELARKRGLYLKGGQLNIEEVARIIIRDWQRNKLVFFSRPEDYNLT